jgi:hypothetical protein
MREQRRTIAAARASRNRHAGSAGSTKNADAPEQALNGRRRNAAHVLTARRRPA